MLGQQDQWVLLRSCSSPQLLCLPSTEMERHVGLLLTAHFSVRCPCDHLSCRRSNTRRWPNVRLLLAHRLRRWANISPVLGYCVVFDATMNVGQHHRRRANINPGPMSQHSVEGLFIERKAVYGCIMQSSTEMKWNESGFRPPLCTYRLNWARRTSWGWWDDWDDTVLQTQDSKFEPWRSEAEHATSRSRRLPTILTFTRGWGRNNFVSFKPPRPGTEPRTLAWKARARRSAWPSDYQGVIIKLHISNNISVTSQRREQWPSIEPTLGVWYKRFKN